MSQKKTGIILALVGVAIALLAIGLIVVKSSISTSDENPENEQVEQAAVDVLGDENVDTSIIDVEAALSERILGNPDAPVKISEHASFSCGHCAHFQMTTFPELKTNWIDSGKAYFVFSDFPLNAPALYASMVARCVDKDRYFEILHTLFEKQNDWAFTSDFFTPLKQIASDYGLDETTFKACVQNKDLQEGILAKVRAAQSQFDINSTPSFVINNAAVIAGGAGYEQFNTALEEAIVKANTPTEEPAETSEPDQEEPVTEQETP